MNAKLFESGLIHYGYHREAFDFPGVIIYSRIYREEKYFVGILNCMADCQYSSRQLYILRNELSHRVPNSSFLIIAFSYDSYQVRSALEGDYGHWIYDEQEQKLMIFEDQPAGFLNVRQLLEGTDVVSRQPSRRPKDFFTITNLLVLANLIVFFIMESIGDTNDGGFLATHGSLLSSGVLENHEYYRIFTSMFMHAGIQHIFGNMLTLYFLGALLERYLGKIKYSLLYLLSGIVANVVTLVYYEYFVSGGVNSVGASGAIFGVIGGLVYLVLIHKGRLADLTISRLAIYLGLSLYMGITSTGINLAAHIGGFMGGFLFAMVLYRGARTKAQNQRQR